MGKEEGRRKTALCPVCSTLQTRAQHRYPELQLVQEREAWNVQTRISSFPTYVSKWKPKPAPAPGKYLERTRVCCKQEHAIPAALILPL